MGNMTKEISDQYVEEVSNASKESIVSADELAKLTDGRGADYITGLPACLRHYSVDQLNALETRFRRKVDRRLLPTLIIMCQFRSAQLFKQTPIGNFSLIYTQSFLTSSTETISQLHGFKASRRIWTSMAINITLP